MNNFNNLSLLMDFYELTMANGYFEKNLHTKICVFEMYFRKNPDKSGFSIFVGLEQVINYLKDLKFSKEDIEFLKTKKIFNANFLNYLKNFKFSCDVWSVKEGSVVFPNEPLIIIKGPCIEAHLIETMILLTINHQSLIATKANRIVRSAMNKKVFEFGTRRAQGYDGAIIGSRAAYIGGCAATSCTISEKLFKIPCFGTMSHSWVQMYKSEYEAFKAYAETYSDNCILLIDTFDTLNSGIINAIKVFKEVLNPLNKRPKAVRIDSGDLAYLSKKVRETLDCNGFSYVEIILSNSLDEYLITDILNQGAKVDAFGVGENLIVSKSCPVFGGIYKLVAIEENNKMVPKIKISESIEKISNPGFKNLYRIRSKENNMSLADYVTLHDEVVENKSSITLFDPEATWKKKTFENIYLDPMLIKIFDKGTLVYETPDIHDIKKYTSEQLNTIWDEIKRFEFPNKYFVNLSKNLFDMKNEILNNYTKNK